MSKRQRKRSFSRIHRRRSYDCSTPRHTIYDTLRDRSSFTSRTVHTPYSSSATTCFALLSSPLVPGIYCCCRCFREETRRRYASFRRDNISRTSVSRHREEPRGGDRSSDFERATARGRGGVLVVEFFTTPGFRHQVLARRFPHSFMLVRSRTPPVSRPFMAGKTTRLSRKSELSA